MRDSKWRMKIRVWKPPPTTQTGMNPAECQKMDRIRQLNQGIAGYSVRREVIGWSMVSQCDVYIYISRVGVTQSLYRQALLN